MLLSLRQGLICVDRLASQESFYGQFGVVTGHDLAAGTFNSSNGSGRNTRDHHVNGLLKSLCASGQDLNTVFDGAEDAALDQFLRSNLFRGVDSSLIDPGLDLVEVDF
ncbi:hypothetical protein HG530_006123 [Fusarium avenaceum]|nr:hypothetical protein HG530_006123 [Fusarium avenaceum]